MATGSYLSIITSNVNGLNAPTKRQRLDEWIQKQDPYICCLEETHLKTRDTYRLKVKGWKKIFHANRDQKKARVVIFISDKIDFKTPLTPMDRSTKQEINKETQTLNDTIDQLDLIDIYRTFHSKTMNFTFFSSAHGTFSRIDYILGHKSSLGKFKKIEIIPSIFSDHNAVRLDLNYRRKTI